MKFRTRTDKVEGGRFRDAYAGSDLLSRSTYDPQKGKEITYGRTYDDKGQKGIYVKQGKKEDTLGTSERAGVVTQQLSLKAQEVEGRRKNPPPAITKQLFLNKMKELV